MKRMNVAVCFVVLSASLAIGQRLPELAVPESYRLSFSPDFSKDNFAGDETITIRVLRPTRQIVLNAAAITFQDVTVLGAERTLKQTREEIDNCIDEKATQAPVVSTWLQQRHAAAAGH